MKKIIIITLTLGLLSLVVFIYDEVRYNNKLLLVFCDVGQGDGAYVRTPQGHDIIIDTGPDSSILACVGAHMPFWDHTIDLVVLSHFNLDHVAGIVDIVRRYEVKRIAVPSLNTDREDVKKYMSLFKEKNIEIDNLGKSDTYKIESNIALKTLGPNIEGKLEENDTSLVQILSYFSYDILFTGDVSYQILNPVLDRLGSDIEVLKVPHHGSKTGLSSASFNSFKPKIAVISSGKNNSYGHPHSNILDLLEKNGIQVRRTDREGDIRFVLK